MIGGNPYYGLHAWMAEYDRKEQETVERERIEELLDRVSQLAKANTQLMEVNAQLLRRIQNDATFAEETRQGTGGYRQWTV